MAPPPAEPGDVWRCDVLIVGAGPAGTAAAIDAARAGLSTVVVDKARFPRDKCCGDGLTTGALRHLEQLGLDPAAIPSWMRVTEVRVRAPSGRSHRFPLPPGGTFAAVCRRRELDQAMVDLAREQGATVLEGRTLSAVSQSGSEVRAEVDGDRFECRYLLAADGMWSPTRKLLGLDQPGYRGEWHAFRQYFTGVTGPAATDLIVWFEPDLLPGYAWSFPLAGGSANVGFGIQRGRGVAVPDMKALWPALLGRHHVVAALGPRARPEGPHRAWPIPARLGRAPLADGRVLFIGDAAAATDPMTGEGIGQAIETGRDAVAAIAGAGPDDPLAAGCRYRQLLAAGMMRDHVLARALSRVLAHRRPTDLALATVGACGWTRRGFGRWLFEGYPRAALLTPRRWHRRMLTSPGAFAGSSPGGALRQRVT
jgi:geranylgeranyl reductase family protein